MKIIRHHLRNRIIISLLFLSFGFSQQEYNDNDLIEMDSGLWTEKFNDEPISGKVYGYFGDEKNPKKVYIGNVRNGKKEGKWVSYYHSTGKKRFEYNFKDGKQDGLSVEWNENGQKNLELTFKVGKEDGRYTLWYDNGQKLSEHLFNDGILDGLYTLWYDNGQKKQEGTYKDGKDDGLFTEWYDNGEKKVEGTFKDGKPNKLIGKWNEDGSVKK